MARSAVLKTTIPLPDGLRERVVARSGIHHHHERLRGIGRPNAPEARWQRIGPGEILGVTGAHGQRLERRRQRHAADHGHVDALVLEHRAHHAVVGGRASHRGEVERVVHVDDRVDARFAENALDCGARGWRELGKLQCAKPIGHRDALETGIRHRGRSPAPRPRPARAPRPASRRLRRSPHRRRRSRPPARRARGSPGSRPQSTPCGWPMPARLRACGPPGRARRDDPTARFPGGRRAYARPSSGLKPSTYSANTSMSRSSFSQVRQSPMVRSIWLPVVMTYFGTSDGPAVRARDRERAALRDDRERMRRAAARAAACDRE